MPGMVRTWREAANLTHDFFRRHWQRALLIRERLKLREETLHLLLAAGVGLIGGTLNLIYYFLNRLLQWAVTGEIGEPTAIAAGLAPWQRVVLPTVGGLVAGGILYWGLR